MLPEVKKVAPDSCLAGACNLFYGLGLANIIDVELTNILSKRIHVESENIDVFTLAKGLCGIGMLGVNPEVATYLSNTLVRHRNFEQLGFKDSLGALWSQCVFGQFTNQTFFKFVQKLNTFEVQNLDHRESHMLREVRNTIEIDLGKTLDEYFNQNLATYCRASDAAHIFDNARYHPYKSLIHRALRGYLSQGLTDKEAEILQENIKAANPNPPYLMDDIFAINGKKVGIFLLGDDGISGNELSGQYKLRYRHLEKIGFTPVTVPIYQIIDVDPYKHDLKLNTSKPIKDIIMSSIGYPDQYLEPLNMFVEKLIKYIKKSEEKVKLDLIVFLEDVLGAYKLQRISRFKTSVQEYKEALQDLKIQLFKINERYYNLSESSKLVVDKHLKDHSNTVSITTLLKTINNVIPRKED